MRGQLNPPIPIILQSITTKKTKDQNRQHMPPISKQKAQKKSLIPPPPRTIKKKPKSNSFLIKEHDSDSY